ncbi:glycosyltransferase family 2 protein [Microbacterium sp. zg.Y909]|uniref:glycosyltransferase family 2 protein n=1 Tax=Microbacterium sp. zg.Y909 TaxID=2969413 RepID=UPI00214BFDFC|nr:glycosyltransferase family 2 protein [Microbacterium sp. zg.Y909]MCR2825900.1 glycosyltransferase [Microbacterium sp. zg.Y909]
MIDPPLVSIVLAAYNAEAHVTGALARLTGQTYRRIEVIVVDDGSEDDTLATARRAAASDPRLRVVANSGNLGVAAARNRGTEAAAGEYIWFADVDDGWSDRFVELMVSAIQATDADVAVCSAEYRYGPRLDRREPVVRYRQRTTLTGDKAAACLLRGTGALWNKLFRRDLLGPAPFPALRSKSDHGALLRVLPRLRTVTIVRDTLYTYIQRDGSISNGGVAEPSNFLSLLTIADQSVMRMETSRALRRAAVRFRCVIIARALRETWRFARLEEDTSSELARRVRWVDLLGGHPADVRTLVTCAAAKCSPGLARTAFRTLGRSRWPEHGIVMS